MTVGNEMEVSLVLLVILYWTITYSNSFIMPAPKENATNCKTDPFGNNYHGSLNQTTKGQLCLHWSSVENSMENYTWDHNYCRNPDMSVRGPWCYVELNGQIKKGACEVPLCAGFPYENRTECHAIECKNNGTLDIETCLCSCPQGFDGFFCEMALHTSAWPEGSYALFASMFGCPEPSNYGWTTGYVNLTVDPSYKDCIWNDDDIYTFEPHILGPFSSYNLRFNFCIMKQETLDANQTKKAWPKGNYCVFKAGKNCPNGFQEGNLTIDSFSLELDGELPFCVSTNFSSSTTDITLQYCCREDGDLDKPIQLVSEFPFILFPGPSSLTCQPVEGMDSSLDLFYLTRPKDDFHMEGIYPKFSTPPKYAGHLGMAFCYYSPKERRECMYKVDNGASYNGRLNITKTGRPCQLWKDVGKFTTDKQWIGEFEYNYCRTAWWQTPPGCQLSENEWELCDIPECDVDGDDLKIFGEGLSYNAPPTLEGSLAGYAVDGKFGPDATASFARLYTKPWFLLNLQEDIEVHAIILYRSKVYFPVNHRYLGTYVSTNRWDFLSHGALRCDDIRNPRWNTIFRYQCKRPITGQYVSVRNFDFPDDYRHGYFHYFELNEIQVIGKPTTCGRRLGMVTGDIYDYQIEASSSKTNIFTPELGRLFASGNGWCASIEDEDPWIMIDLIVPVRIQGIEFQGIKSGQKVILIESFYVLYGIDRNKLGFYENPKGHKKVFKIDQDVGSSVQTIRFNKEILGRFLKIELAGYSEPCLKIEIIGCPVRVTRDLFCKEKKYDFGYEVQPNHVFWMEQDHNLDKMFIKTKDNKECIESCQNINCLTFTYTNSNKECFMHYGHHYTPNWKLWWVGGFDHDRISYQRLCFKEFSDFKTCNHTIYLENKDSATIFSPSFPLHYGNGLECSWVIESPTFIEIEFISTLLPDSLVASDLQRMGVFDINPGSCVDRLKIINANDEKVVSPTTTIQKGQKMISTTSRAVVELSSCFQLHKYTDQAFELKVTNSDLPGCGSFGTCFKTCKEKAAYIITPGFPVSYNNDEVCFWKIEGEYGQYITFDFLSLDVVDDSTCEKSFVIISDVDLHGNTNRIGRFCKENRPMNSIISSWHKLNIEFRASREFSTGGGFKGKYLMQSFIQKTFASENNTCGADWHTFGNSCYTVVKETKLTWLEAERRCKTIGGHLVSIGNIDEMEYIHYLVTVIVKGLDDDSAYIGLTKKTDGNSVADFVWSDGSPLTYTAWFTSSSSESPQPDGFKNEQCSILKLFSIHNMNNWHDVACAYDKISNFICEKRYFLKEEYSIRDSLTGQIEFQNDTTLFQCESGEVILSAFICDQIKDCLSGEDEQHCAGQCTEEQFTCTDGGCISISLHCDFIDHCRDRSDELSCERRNCTGNEWQCTNKQCIELSTRCDFVNDCFDMSDEHDCDFCDPESFQCYDQTCIPKSRVCDGFIDCSGLFHEDEPDHCHKVSQHTCADWWSVGKRKNGEYKIDLYTNETANVECSFEERSNLLHVSTIIHHNKEDMLLFRTSRDFIPRYYAKGDHISFLKDKATCSQSLEIFCSYAWETPYRVTPAMEEVYSDFTSDNCSCPFVGNCVTDVGRCNCATENEDWYTAGDNEIRSDRGVLTNHSEIPIIQFTLQTELQFYRIYIGPLVCEQDVQVSSNVFQCHSGQTVPSDVKCLLSYDERGELVGCRDMSHLNDCQQFDCPEGFLKCSKSFCIPPRMLCNHVKDCPLGEDEMQCEKPKCAGLFKCRRSSICINLSKRCDGHAQCPLFDDELLCHNNCPENCTCTGLQLKCSIENNSTLTFPVEVRKIDLSYSSLETSILELDDNFLLAELNLSSTMLHNVEFLDFGPSHNLYLLDLSFNKIRYIPSNAFKGLRHLTSLLLRGNGYLHSIFPQSFNGLDSLPSLAIQNARISSLQYKTFNGLKSLDILNISSNQLNSVEDGTFDGLINLKTIDMRKNKIVKFSDGIFLGLEKLETIYSDAFVFCCLRPASVREENCMPTRDEFSSCEDMMRNDLLRVCLWVIGFSALLGNFVVLCYRFVYDRSSLRKGHGIFISCLCISDFIMGIYLLMIATADVMFRGNYVWNDLSWRYGKTCKVAGILSTFSSECSVMFLFMITIDRFCAIKYPFGQIRFDRKLSGFISSGLFIASIFIAIAPLLPGSYFDGEFYSRSAVCLAMPLTRDRPKGWEYSFGIFIVFNFVLFIVIAAFQLVIYREVKSTSQRIRSTQKRKDLTIARSLFVVVFSDFLCWFPVGVMGLMAMGGHPVPGDVYAWTAVFILPINSALNPFLYTFSAIIRERRRASRKSSNTAHSLVSANLSTASAGKTNGNSDSQDTVYSIVEKLITECSLKPDDIPHLIKQLESFRALSSTKHENDAKDNKKVEVSLLKLDGNGGNETYRF